MLNVSSSILISQILADKHHDMPSLIPTVAQEVNVATDALRHIAVVASAINPAGRADVKTLGINWGCRAASPGQCCLYRLGHLVETDDEDDLLRPPGDSSHTIAIAVDIHDDTVF